MQLSFTDSNDELLLEEFLSQLTSKKAYDTPSILESGTANINLRLSS